MSPKCPSCGKRRIGIDGVCGVCSQPAPHPHFELPIPMAGVGLGPPGTEGRVSRLSRPAGEERVVGTVTPAGAALSATASFFAATVSAWLLFGLARAICDEFTLPVVYSQFVAYSPSTDLFLGGAAVLVGLIGGFTFAMTWPGIERRVGISALGGGLCALAAVGQARYTVLAGTYDYAHASVVAVGVVFVVAALAAFRRKP